MAVKELDYGAVEIFNSDILGTGSYGQVCKAKYGQLPCAAKLLLDILLDTNDPGIHQFVERFEQECQLLRAIKHPNIVQFLGTSRDSQSRRLVLLMELMDESLTKFLERSTSSLPYHTQLNICYDVGLALAYLHRNNIMHRDLSSNNVLLIGEGTRAKVTDFGMSKLEGMNPRMTPLTMCPGTTVYMPPEALVPPPRYSSTLDCFSHGVLTIQIVTRQFPDPGNAITTLEDASLSTSRALVLVPETERRKKHIDLIASDHPLLPFALHCLKDWDTERPSADELCERLATLKGECKYTKSVEQSKKRSVTLQTLQLQMEKTSANSASQLESDTELGRPRQQNHEKSPESELGKESMLEQVTVTQAALQEKTEECEQNQLVIRQLQEEVTELRQKLEQTHKPVETLNVKPSKDHHPKLQWRQGTPSTVRTSSLSGAAAVFHKNAAYFSKENCIHSYTPDEDKWTRLTPCQWKYFGLAVVNEKLTTIGGYKTEPFAHDINTLASYVLAVKWEVLLPPMPTKRQRPATITLSTQLIAAGGKCTSIFGDSSLYTVEVLDLNTLQWSAIKNRNSPKLAYPHSLTVCGDYLYLSGLGTAIFSCSVQDLLEVCKSSTTTRNSVWSKVTDVPVPHGSNLVTLRGHLLAIGGHVINNFPTTTIHSYDRNANSWSIFGKLPTPRTSAVVTVSSDELFVMGGKSEDNSTDYVIDIAQY